MFIRLTRLDRNGLEISNALAISIHKVYTSLHLLDGDDEVIGYVERIPGKSTEIEGREGARRSYYRLTFEGRRWVEDNMMRFVERQDYTMV